ncbi:MAG: Gfo/Idh/MocA family oxidoreductase [Treponema sp.]|jgi:predicted dehydrogenase|nr:Gfo/Idh/MocA family oxidoreductase [Treponema sp.]
MKTVKFGVIGCGLMGKEFASAAARWCHLNAGIARPEITAAADINPANSEWFAKNIPTVKHVFTDYKQLLELEEIEAVYAAVPHVLHQQVYTDILRAGKHLMGEKPFGMDKTQNDAIMAELAGHPGLVVRCASEYPFYPAMQMVIKWISEKRFGRILEIRCGFNHASDMDVTKPINWKRQAAVNGEYGCMGDLGIHTQHVPFRMGFKPENVFVKLSKYVTQRPDGKGGMVPCDTWDNATVICDARDHTGNLFPMYMETKRMDPGCTDNWFFEIYGLDCSAKFTSLNPNVFSYLVPWGKEQAWADINIGYKPMIPTVTGPIFEFGFTDAILQMWAAYMSELEGKPLFFTCFTPEETVLSHKVYTAALESHKSGRVVGL